MKLTAAASQSNGDVIFFERSGTYRQWPIWLAALLFLAAGLVALCLIVLQFIQGRVNFGEPWGIAFAVLWTAGMLGVGGILAYRLLLKPRAYSRIDTHGITIDKKHYPWHDITWVFTKSAMNGVTLCYHRKGMPLDLYIHTLPLLRPAEAEEILERLDEFLRQQHPHVDVG